MKYCESSSIKFKIDYMFLGKLLLHELSMQLILIYHKLMKCYTLADRLTPIITWVICLTSFGHIPKVALINLLWDKSLLLVIICNNKELTFILRNGLIFACYFEWICFL